MTSPCASSTEEFSPVHSSDEACSRRRLVFRHPLRGKSSRTCSGNDELSYAGGCAGGSSSIEKAAIFEELGSSSSTTRMPTNGPIVASPFVLTLTATSETEQKKRTPTWSHQESMVFYEALKQYFYRIFNQHGKDFDAISKYLLRKKIQRDKPQVRNYYFNLFKLGCAKAQVEESAWQNVPQEARELFVILNGCEWKKRTDGLDYDPPRFKALILEGIVSLKDKRKKSSLATIRTPNCPALLKFFPYHRRNVEMPSHIDLKLLPLRNQDRSYVCSCEQNPYVRLQMNVNDKIQSVFCLLHRKWKSGLERVAMEHRMPVKKPTTIKLRIGDQETIHKIQVEMSDDPNSLISLKKLKRDCDNKRANALSGENANQDEQAQCSAVGDTNIIRLNGSVLKEVFEIDEEKIRDGLTSENTGNASLIQLFYLMGMKETVSMRYEICFDDDSQQGQGGLRGEQPWSAFSSFVARDYDDLMAKSTAYIPPPQQITSENNHPTASQMTSQNPQIASQNPNTTQKNGVVFGGGDENPMENGEKKRGASADDQRFIRPAAETPASSGKSPHFSRSSAEKRPQSNSNCSNALLSPQPQQPTLADEECSGFADQIRAIRNRKPTNLGRPKRQVKLILDGPRTKRVCSSPPPFMAYQPNNSSSSSSLSAAEKGQQICYVLENGVATPISASSANFSALNGQKQQILYLVPNSQQKNVQANQILVQPVQSITPLGVGDSPSTGEQTIAYLPQNVLIHANASSRRQIGTPPPPTDFSQMVIGSYATNSGELRPSPGRSFHNCQNLVVTSQQTAAEEHSVVEFSLDNSSLGGQSLFVPPLISIEGGSPSKSMTNPDHLISHTVEQMIHQNSVDFCRNFEQLTKMTKTSL